ncbi:MAG: type II secretion system minor pseudopilin GspJ [Hyphomonadaceae bacterium]
MTRQAHPEAGFTLVEALVSLFIFALVAGGGVLLLSQTLQAQGRIETAQDELRAIQSARALLAADLAQLAPRPVREDGHPALAFHGVGGAEPSMSFVRAAGDPGSSDRITTKLVAVEYSIDEQGKLVRSTRDAIDPGAKADSRQRTLVAAPGETRFEFNDGAGWREDWPPSAFGVPRAVAITLTLPRYGKVRLQALTGL